MRLLPTSAFVILLVGCAQNELAPVERTGVAASALVTDCDYLNPSLFPLPAVPIDFQRELVITSLGVVEDPCRTTWTAGGCSPNELGVWTAGQLFTQLSGQPVSLPPAPLPLPAGLAVTNLLGEWVHSWEVPQIVNGFPVAPRPSIRPLVIDPWIAASVPLGAPAALCFPGAPVVGPGACPLDPRAAPLRLLAIVNRVDLGGNTTLIPATPGEGRFVFGVTNPGGAPLPFTVIFEYKLPSSQDTIQWEQDWHLLSSLVPGTTAYNTTLQSITDAFSLAGVEPGNPNMGSSIGSVRTNEIALAAPWELRTFALVNQGTGPNSFLLQLIPLDQTPDDGVNLSPDLDQWQVKHEPFILAADHVVPLTFPSGSPALGGATTAPFVWNNGGSSGPLSPMARHLFGFATCNGCHTTETGGTPFVHIDTRPAGVPSSLSPFLSQTTAPGPGGLPAGALSFPDPVVGPSMMLSYNEPWRRTCEAARLLAGDPQPFTKANGAH